MIRPALIAAVLIGLGGCAANKGWYNPVVSNQHAQRDVRECKYDATKYGYVQNYGTGVGAGIEQALRENEIMKDCMTARGYSLVSRDSVQ
jgi:hypothetical protein